MNKTIIAIAIAISMVGCITEPKVESTKPWEGHYYSVDELRQSTDGMHLDKDESIWVLSNHTLNRLLKSTLGK